MPSGNGLRVRVISFFLRNFAFLFFLEKPYLFKVFSDVASLTLPTELPFVDVISTVAIDASFGYLATGLAVVGVTGMAVQTDMGAGQRVFCLTVMIKYPALPTIGIVAGGAGAAEFTFVIIVAGVAFRTEQGGLFERRVDVAALTGNQGMQANQWKPCDVMFENHIVAPAFGRMAGVAFFAQLTLVGVIITVAIATLFRRFLVV